MLTAEWEVLKVWSCKVKSHINLLELRAAEKLVETQAKRRLSLRFLSMVDFNVSRGALSKGRSASRAVSAILRRINSTLVTADLYVVDAFCPLRLHVADDPARDREVRPSVPGLGSIFLSSRFPQLSMQRTPHDVITPPPPPHPPSLYHNDVCSICSRLRVPGSSGEPPALSLFIYIYICKLINK